MATVTSVCRKCGKQLSQYTDRWLEEDVVLCYLVCEACKWLGAFHFPKIGGKPSSSST